MSKLGLFSSAARAAMTAIGIQPGDEGEQPAPLPTPAPSEDPPADPPAEPVTPAPAPAAAVTADIVTPAQANAQRLEAAEAGAAAERTRVAAVFAAPEALTNPGLAAWLIVNAPGASAESIVGQLKTAPVDRPAAASAAQTIAPTNISVGAGPAVDGDGGESEDGGMSIWGEVQKSAAAANAPIAIGAHAAAGVNGATTVQAFVPRTGN